MEDGRYNVAKDSMGAEPTPVVLRIAAWSGRGTLSARPEGIPAERRRTPIAPGVWDDCHFWKDRTGDRAGMNWFDARIGWSCRDLERVHVQSIGRAKGAGWFELSLAWKGDSVPSAILVTDRWHEEDREWFEAAGGDLARLLGVPYQFYFGADA